MKVLIFEWTETPESSAPSQASGSYLELIEVEKVSGPHHPLGLDSWTKGKGVSKLVALCLLTTDVM